MEFYCKQSKYSVLFCTCKQNWFVFSENNNIIIDCGEGTFGQIIRFFGKSKAYEILANINAIYVSHLHADHHIGLLGMLQGRENALKLLKRPLKPVYLLAPIQILAWLNFYDKCFEDIQNLYTLIPNTDLVLLKIPLKTSFNPEIFSLLVLVKVLKRFLILWT